MSTMTITTNLPAAAALAASEADLDARLMLLRADAMADYSEQTKAELTAALARVRANRPPHVAIPQPRSNATKADLVTILANAAAAMSPVKAELDALRRAASREEEIIEKATEAQTIEEVRAERDAKIAEVAAQWDAEQIADVAFEYDAKIALTESWQSVASIMRSQGKSPKEALTFVVDHRTRQVIMTAGRGSRSSSPTANLAREAKLAGQVKFLEEARWLG